MSGRDQRFPQYAFVYPEQDEVWSVRPGITDPASVRFRNESELLSGVEDVDEYYRTTLLPQKIEMYLEYVRSRTFTGDMRILAQTVMRVIAPASKGPAQEG